MGFSLDRPVWHFTHGSNLRSILDEGGLLADALARPSAAVGDPAIKARRAARRVPCPPAGVVADYVPFYFRPRGPMFYRVVDPSTDGWEQRQRSLVYLQTTPARLAAAGCACVYTDRNAVLALAAFAADGAACPIDWELIDAQWAWVGQQEDWRARVQAELLAHRRVPIEAVESIGVADAPVGARVEELLGERGDRIRVEVQRDWYIR